MGACHVNPHQQHRSHPRDIQRLCNAVRNQNIDLIETCLSKNISIVGVSPHTDQTPLEIASLMNDTQLFDNLVFSQRIHNNDLCKHEKYIKHLDHSRKIDPGNAKHMLTSINLAMAMNSNWM